MKTVVKTLLFLLSFSGCNELWMSSCWGCWMKMALRKAQAAARGCRRKAAAAIAGVVHGGGGLKSCWREEGGGGHTVYLILSRGLLSSC